MRIILNIFLISSCLFLVSCSDFLERDMQTDTTLSYEEIFKDKHYALGFLNNIYGDLPVGFSRMGYATLAGACDEAVISNSTSSVHLFNRNGISSSSNPDDNWYVMYRSIRKCNIFLKELDGIIASSNSIALADRPKYKGEALFLRAYMHFELLKRYQNIIWVNGVVDPFNSDSIYQFKQKSFQVMTQILSDQCDSAAKYLPKTPNVGATLGRPIASAPLALKSRLWLYAASPLNNPTNDVALWKKAEQAALDVITQYATIHPIISSGTSYNDLFAGTTPGIYNKEVIFGTSFVNRNDLEKYYFPISFGGSGLINPSQDLVNSYPMQASAYNDPMNEKVTTNKYDPANPYINRDARFYYTIAYNGMELQTGNFIETFNGGKDAYGKSNSATKTGYYLRKYLNPALNIKRNDVSRRQWIIFRYAEILLNYAEARNEVLSAPDNKVWTTVNPIRLRGKLRPFPTSGVLFDKVAMREYLKKERRIEFAFEESRFWDLRRWKNDAITVLNQPVKGINITRGDSIGLDANGKIIYKLNYTETTVESRFFDSKFFWYPIPYSEIIKYKATGNEINQNEGWN